MLQEDIEALDNLLFTLDWLLGVSARHFDSIKFGLAHIGFGNPSILGEAYGAQEASQKLDEVLHSLRKSFRKTDLVARDGVDFWVLVPYTAASELLSDKIKGILESVPDSDLQIVERDISIFFWGDEGGGLSAGRTASEFLSYLAKNHTQLSRQEVALPAIH